ncbi:protein Mpv17-like isoform X2 [Chrysoperla carnea]|uniref:protein Mpv17-like isoform X2 n=1 Tax=Chrysoperla carnea TaxID=189513 RepID=UPI001D078F37|nr:protein Mpv17-like isoform X2 [Chrysoperla carnea]
MSHFHRALHGYLKIARCYPYAVQMIEVGLLMAGGDIIAQQLIEKTEKHDWLRTKQFGAVGALFVGPGTTSWYKILEKKFGHGMVCGKHDPRLTRIVGLKKMVADQILFAPLFLGAFLLLIGRLKCKKWDRNVEDLKTQYPAVLTSNYMIWPFVQLVNFTFVPLHMQVLLVQTVALFWNTYLSWRTAKTGDGQAKLDIPDEEKIDSYWCRPKTSTPIEEAEPTPLPPKCKKKEEPEPPVVPETPPTDEDCDETVP